MNPLPPQRGWHLDRQQFPSSLHLTVTPAHAQVCEQILDGLRESVAAVKTPSASRLAHSMAVGLARTAANVLPEKLVSDLTARSSSALGLGEAQVPARSAAVYGMMASLPNREEIDELVLDLLEQLTRPQEVPTDPQSPATE